MKTITKIIDVKEKQIWVESLAENYLEFVDYNIRYQIDADLFYVFDNNN